MTVSISGTSGLSVNSLPFVVGQVCFFAMQTSPTGFLVCDGSAVSRTTYASVFAAIGTLYGAGNGSTTFNLPDLRGEFIRGYDGGRGIDSARTFGTNQIATSVMTGDPNTTDPSLVTIHNKIDDNDQTLRTALHGEASTANTSLVQVLSAPASIVDPATAVQVSMSVRPRNVALLPCIFVGV